MLDLALPYVIERDDEDTIVIDDPDARARDQELTMHVMVEGEWHRMLPDLSETSCEKRYHSAFSPLRMHDQLVHPLCGVCFTPGERRLADKHTERERAAANGVGRK